MTEVKQCGDKAEGRGEGTTEKQSWSLSSYYSGHFRSLGLQRPRQLTTAFVVVAQLVPLVMLAGPLMRQLSPVGA